MPRIILSIFSLFCLFVFYVPSTARSFRDGTPIYWELNPGPSRGSSLLYRCATPAPFYFQSGEKEKEWLAIPDLDLLRQY